MFHAFLFILVLHFVGDFILQSDWMAIHKSKNWGILGIHCAVYVIPYMVFYFMFGWWFVPITFALHFVQDAITSRITAKLWQAGERHWFFVTIGADQLLHYYLLALTLYFTR